MSEKRWSGSIEFEPDSEEVPFGPLDEVLPSKFRANVSYSDDGLRVQLRCSFDGLRIAVSEVKLAPLNNGGSISASDLTRLELAAVIHDMGSIAMHLAPANSLGFHGPGTRSAARPTPDELKVLAGVYWAEYVIWGDPRKAIMAIWGLPRSTANRWIRLARDLYPLPGQHDESLSTGDEV